MAEKSKKRKTNRKSSGFLSAIIVGIIILIAAGIIWWFLPNLIDWSLATWESLLNLFGAGLALIAIYILIIIIIFARRQFSVLAKYWNRWLGGISFTFAVWGLLAFVNPALGGTFGQGIIGTSPVGGAFIILGLVILGILFIAPKQFWHALVTTVRATGKAIWLIVGGIWEARSKAGESRKAAKPEPVQEIRFEQPAPVKTEAAVQKAPLPPITGLEDTKPATAEPLEPTRYQSSLTVGGWQLPPITILDKAMDTEVSQSDVEKRAEIITEALGSYGVDAKVVQINIGPTVTQFGVEPGWDIKYKEIKERDKDGNSKTKLQEISRTRVKVERITSLANDLALALAAPSIRIEAPVPGKSIIGVEVPNTTFGSVNLRGIIESTAFQKISAKSKLAIALGKGAGGETVASDLAKMPHVLIAGATGSGKTVYLNSIICCLLVHNTPDDLRFVMIDPKRVELVNFNSLPHLIAPVVVESNKAVASLRWLTQEMDERYRKFAQSGARNIEGYNQNLQPGDTMPYIVLFIDELADLMMAAFDEVEHTLCRLAQLARATGIHLVVATQRPSVDVVTGLIKANFPTRISFTLTSQVDSRTILDSAGAEKLLGRGDMLYMPSDAAKPKRLQGPFLSDAEIDRLTAFWNDQRHPDAEAIRFEDAVQSTFSGIDSDDSLMEEARRLAEEHENISSSFLQRRLRIGYPRAARIYDKLKEEGY